MKTIISKSLLVAGLALSMALTSCDDYLGNVPKGQKIPTTLEDFSTMNITTAARM